MRKGLVFTLLFLVLCEFAVGGVYSEVETNFVVMGVGGVSNDLSFWGMYGDYIIVGAIVLVVVVIYLKMIKESKKSKKKVVKKRGKKRK